MKMSEIMLNEAIRYFRESYDPENWKQSNMTEDMIDCALVRLSETTGRGYPELLNQFNQIYARIDRHGLAGHGFSTEPRSRRMGIADAVLKLMGERLGPREWINV